MAHMPSQDAQSERPIRMPYQDAQSECPIRMPNQDGQSEHPIRMPNQDALSGYSIIRTLRVMLLVLRVSPPPCDSDPSPWHGAISIQGGSLLLS